MFSGLLDFKLQVQRNWLLPLKGTYMFQLVHKLKCLKSVMKTLNKGKYSDVEKKCEQAQKKLIDVQIQLQNAMPNVQLQEECNAMAELRQL